MSLAAERAFFDGDQCQHVADREEAQRLARKRDAALAVADAERRARQFTRLSDPLPVSQVPMFQDALDAVLSLPRLRRNAKEN